LRDAGSSPDATSFPRQLKSMVARQSPEAKASSRPWFTLGMLAVVTFAWGGNYTWIKIALRDIGPWTFNAVRFCVAALVVGVVLLLRRGPRHTLPQYGERTALAVIGLLPGAVLTMLITVSLMWIESIRTILLIYTNPVWTLLLSALILGERLTIFNTSGVVLGLAGVVLLTNPLALDWQASSIPGIGAALLGSSAWALGSVLYRRRTWNSSFWQQVFWQLAASGVVTAVAAVVFERHQPPTPSPQLILIMIYNVLVPTALAFWCWSQVLTRIRASIASQILLLSPVFGIAQSHLVLAEPLSDAILASACCVVAGACLTFVRPRATERGRGGGG
jgi:drug/metabolite transporter (DMT)-like permease